MKSIAEKSLELTGLFEAEVFVLLLLKNWGHPLADDKDFANELLESTSEVLRRAVDGEQFIEGMPAGDLNFVAAVWYAEQCATAQEGAAAENFEARKVWLAAVRRTLPSCFCDPKNLGES
jgi:hypothetical protein